MQRTRPTRRKTSDTRTQLLDAAERLFAAHGVASVSVRDIIRAAGTNLGAINYHFGALENLIVAVFERRIEPVDRARLAALNACEQRSQPPTVEDILAAFIHPALEQATDPAQGGTACARMMGRSMGEPNPTLERALRRHTEPVIRRFDAAFMRAIPGLSPEDVHFRMMLVVGALHLCLMTFERTPPPPLSHQLSLRQIEHRLVLFAAAGFRCSIPPGGATPTRRRPLKP